MVTKVEATTIAEANVTLFTGLQVEALQELFNKWNVTAATLTLENISGESVEFEIEDFAWGKIEPMNDEEGEDE